MFKFEATLPFTDMRIELTDTEIEKALPAIQPGLSKYLWLQSQVNQQTDLLIANRHDFRRKFNYFYRVRRGQDWQDKFYTLMDDYRHEQVSFRIILESLQKVVNRCEASFASKLLATINPQMPVIDSIVMQNLGCRLPSVKTPDRLAAIFTLHHAMCICFKEYLKSDQGAYLVHRFRTAYPEAVITEIKMLGSG